LTGAFFIYSRSRFGAGNQVCGDFGTFFAVAWLRGRAPRCGRFTVSPIGGLMGDARPQKITFAEMQHRGRDRRPGLLLGLSLQPLETAPRRSLA
jgi:hypothetical protein